MVIIQKDFLDISAHFVIAHLFKCYPKTAKIYCYEINIEKIEQIKLDKNKLIVGKFEIRSEITFERDDINFAILHYDGEIMWGVSNSSNDDGFKEMSNKSLSEH